MTTMGDPVNEFIVAACVPRDASHSSGTLERAEAILTAHPEVRGHSIHTAAILGDAAAVQRFLASDKASATAKGGPHAWDALTYLCFSRYLQLDPARSEAFVRAATVLLDAGASANTGWFESDHQPRPEWEPVLYGAAGIAHHPELTRLLLERGANPTDNEVVYHTPESDDNRALKLIVETGKLGPEDLALMLIRKHDWHDYDGQKYLLEHGADPNRRWGRGISALHHALARGNWLKSIELLLDHGADPGLVQDGISAAQRAAREGRGDVLEVFERRGVGVNLAGVDRLLAACARNDAVAVESLAQLEPGLATEVRRMGGSVIARFISNWNADGVRQLLDLGIPANAPFAEGDGYLGIPKGSLPIHVAAWQAQPVIVKLLLERGSPADAPDANGRTPLALAVRACVDSYWTERRSPDSVAALLNAGASVKNVKYPSGYEAVDTLLRKAGAR